MRKILILSLIYKILQGLIAFLSIMLQSHFLNRQDFIHFSIIANAMVLSTFMDFGVGTQFIQNHFSSDRNDLISEGESLYRHFVRQKKTFLLIALFQSLIVSSYSLFLVKLSMNTLSLFITIILCTFVYSYTNFISRLLIAIGKISLSLQSQAIGICLQLLFSTLAFVMHLSLNFFVFTLVIPNLYVAVCTWNHLFRNNSYMIESQKRRKISYKLANRHLQSIQIIQLVYGLIPVVILNRRISEIDLLATLVEWRIFSSVASAMSSINFAEWKKKAEGRAINIHPTRSMPNLWDKSKFALLFSVSAVVATYLLWNPLTGGHQSPKLLILCSWTSYVLLQVIQWHFYYILLASEQYFKILIGTIIQLVGTLFFIELHLMHNEFLFLLAIDLGLVLSILYFLDKVNKVNDNSRL